MTITTAKYLFCQTHSNTYFTKMGASYLNWQYSVIDRIISRPGTFLGCESISSLEGFLSGYGFALSDIGIANSIDALLPLPFNFFCDYIAIRLGYRYSETGWRRMLLEKSNSDEIAAFRLFVSLYEDYKHLQIERYRSSVLSEENIFFHEHNSLVPQRSTDSGHCFHPIYPGAKKIFCIELSLDSGWLLVESESEFVLNYTIFRQACDLFEYVQRCFGVISNWQEAKVENIFFDEKPLRW